MYIGLIRVYASREEGGGGADNKAIEIRSIIEKNIIKDVGNEKT